MLQTGRSRVRDLMRLIFAIDLILPAEMSTRNIKIKIELDRCVGMTTLPPSVSRLLRQYGILNMSQSYRPPRPVTGISLLTVTSYLRISNTISIFSIQFNRNRLAVDTKRVMLTGTVSGRGDTKTNRKKSDI
jgi:hypothetical protein